MRPSVLSLTTLFHLLRDHQVSSQISFLPVGRIPLRRSLDIATYELFPAQPKVSSINFPSVRSQSTRGGGWVDRLRGTTARTFLCQTFPGGTRVSAYAIALFVYTRPSIRRGCFRKYTRKHRTHSHHHKHFEPYTCIPQRPEQSPTSYPPVPP